MSLDKKIDELILKNIQKDYVSLKIKVDYNFNRNLIFFCLIMIIYSLLVLFKPKNLNFGIYSFILYLIPVLVFNIFNDFKNNYLKYSSELSKIIFNFVGIFMSVNIFIFISLLIFKFFSEKIVNNYPNTFLFFIPIYSMIVIMLLFAFFLRKGFNKMNKILTHNLIIFNLIISFILISLIHLKINSMTNKANWFHIMILVSFYHLANYLGFSYMTQFEKRSNKNPSIEDKSILLILDILLNFSSIGFYLIFGLMMDKTIKINEIILYVIFWFFFGVLIFKAFYKNKKIKDFLEWRNVAIK